MSKPAPRSASRLPRLLLLTAIALFGLAILLQQVYFARRVHAAGFTAGNIVVYRVGDGAAALGSGATAVFLDEYTPAGALVQSIALPTAVNGLNRRLTSSGTATNEGMLTRSADGLYVVLTGYDANLGTAAVAGTTSSTVNRVVGRVDTSGNVDTTTVFAGTAGNSFSTVGIRSVTSDAGSNFWAVGANTAGVQYITLGATSSSPVSTTVTNLRGTHIFGGQLYISTASGTAVRIGTVGTGTPTTSGQTMTNLPGFPTTGSPNQFFFADLTAAVPGVDTLYVADDSPGAIQKYSLSGGSWVANGSVAVAAARGLTGSIQGTTVTLFGTSGSAGTTLFTLVDSAGYNVTISGSPTNIVTAGTNKAFRGVALAPSSGPPNQAIVPSCPASLTTTQGIATSAGVSASDPDGIVTSASITSLPVSGITLDSFTPAGAVGGTANATLNVANTTAVGDYSVVIQYSNNDSPTPQTATCTVAVHVTAPNQPINTNCPTPLTTTQGIATSEGVSATDPDGTVTSASIISAPVAGITLNSFTPAAGSGGTATATLNVSNTTAIGTYNVTIRYSNNDGAPQTADCTVVVNVNVPPDSVVISQIYGGGGNTGSTYKNDFIELINHSGAPINLNGWSVQAWSFTTNSWQATPLTNVTLQPGQYYLVQESQGAGGTDNLPTPDAIGTIAISSGSTKVALVSNTTVISAACPNQSAVVDLVSYGSDPVIGTCYEGSGAAPQLSNTIAIQRRNEGCFDSDDNAADFITIAPGPHNTSSAVHDCTGLSAFGSANPSTVVQGESSTLTVRVDPAQNPASTGVSVTADLSSIGGSASQPFIGSGDVFTYTANVPVNNPPGMKSLLATVSDLEGHTTNTNILLSILPIIADHVTISQIYGGGGNAGATYSNDYVELYNPTAATVTMTGWSLQYGSATGATFTGKTVIGGTIAPGAHYLVSLASQNVNVGAPLPPPPPSVSGDINMAAGAGKIALVRNSDTLAGPCPVGSDPDIVDFVGYGATANCHEGNANAPGPSNNTTALFRKNNGETDSDQNGNDLVTGAPNPRSESPVAEFGPSVAGTEPASNSTTAPYDSTIAVFFSEPVTVDSGWYNIICTATGSHTGNVTEAHSSDQKTYAVTPNISFQFGEQCTVTITKTAVHDVDRDDSEPGSDTLADDYVWSFTVVGAGQPAPYPPSVHLTMGNPSGADLSQPLNYLMEKPTYSLSYNRDKGTPNWVSWHLENTWYGTLARVDTFRADPKVDPTWYRVQSFDYTNSGFDRGHMTPNADRDNQNRIPINQETYLMTNMIPQAPDNNQGPWADLEAYLRTQTDLGNEIYIVSGPQGVGGTGANGAMNSIANGHVTVPAKTWKVALVLPSQSGDDIARVTCSTRTIAVILPNVQGIRNDDWTSYLTTVDAVEQLTGYDLFSNLPPAVQACVEAGTNGTNPPGTANQSANTAEDNSVTVTLEALRSNNNTLTFSIMGGPTSGSLGSVSAATCAGGSCTATVSYTPGPDFNGADSFTFRASDGSVHSNTSTVSVGVSEVNDSPSAATDSKSTAEDVQLSFSASDLTTNDSAGPANESGQALTVTTVVAAANTHGTVQLVSGTVTYTPAANYNGPASFTYSVCDDGTTNGSPDPKCTTGTVNVTVTPVNDAPTANSQSKSTGGNTPVAITLTGSDLETSPANLTFNVTSGPSHGTLSGTAPNLTYTPALNYCGSDSFKFTVTDTGDGTAAPVTSSEATVSITVNDTIGPTITLTGGVLTLSPPNHNYQLITMSDMVASASDHCDPGVDINDVVITKVTSDELDNAPGNDDGNTVNDIVIAANCKSVQLRAERNGSLNGRVYTVTLRVSDSAGNTTTATRKIIVPVGSGSAVDSGPAYTVISGCP